MPCNLHVLVEFNLPRNITEERKAFTSFTASSFDIEATHGCDLVSPSSLFPTAEMIAVETPILAHCPVELQSMSGFFFLSPYNVTFFLPLILIRSLFQTE